MLLAPTLALLTIVFNFCALLHVTNQNGLSTSRWPTFDRVFYALEETTVAAYTNYLGIVAPPPPASSSVYFPALRRAEWVYRSSVVRMLDLVDGPGKAQAASGVAFPPPLTEQTDHKASTGPLPPTLTSPIHPATFESSPEYELSILRMIASPVAQLLILAGFFFCLAFALGFAWLKNHRSCQPVSGPKPILTCDVDYQTLAEDFYSVYTATSIPSYTGSELDFVGSELGDFSDSSRNFRIHHPTTPRIFPVVITSSNGKVLLEAEIKLSSNHVDTTLSARTSIVSFSLDVVASLDVPTVSEWYIPSKEDGDVSAHDSAFLLLVRGTSDRVPLTEKYQDSGCTSEPEDITLFVDQTDAQTLVSDCEIGDTDARDIAPLGSPMCPVTIPIHHRGFSSFETALINSGTKAHRANAREERNPRRSKARTNIQPRDVSFPWLGDISGCWENHLDGCLCELMFAEDVLSEQYPPPNVTSGTFHDHDAAPEFNLDTRSEERGSGMSRRAYTVFPGLSVRSEVPPTSTSGPAEPRLAARSDTLLADGKEPAGLDSTVALLPSFSFVSPELTPRSRSSGISTPAEFTGGAPGEQSVSSENGVKTGHNGEYTSATCFADGIRSPPSPVIPAQVDLLMDALEPILADYTSPPSPKGAALNHLENTPLQYSPSSTYHPVDHPATPEYEHWAGEATGTTENVSEGEVNPRTSPDPFAFLAARMSTNPQTPVRKWR